MKGHRVLTSRGNDDWGTPQALYDRLHLAYDFDVDAAANAANAKCPKWFGPDGLVADALAVRWAAYGRRFFCNPPYSLLRQFLEAGAQAQRDLCTVVFLIPARTDTRAWHDHIWDAERGTWRPDVTGNFLKGRLRFEGATAGAPFPSCIIVMHPSFC